MNGRVLGGLCAVAALGLDQGTKALALTTPATTSLTSSRLADI